MNEGQLLKLGSPVNSAFIANPEIADISVKSSRLVYVFGKAPGETTFFAVDENENVIANRRIVVTHNTSRLNSALQQVAPGSEVQAVSVDGGIVLVGAVPNPDDSDNMRRIAERFIPEGQEVINQLVVTLPNQVNLRVRVAEVQRTLLNQFGVNWDVAFDNTDMVFGIATGQPTNPWFLPGGLLGTVSPLSAAALQVPGRTGTFFTRRSLEQNSGFGHIDIGSTDINALIDALAEDGLIALLAEPNLTALSGETASFLAGGEFPIVVSESNDRFRIEFKQFGVSLAFTPTILNNRRMSMRVRPEVSQLSDEGAITLTNFTIPALRVRRAETTVELASGQSFAIAGLRLNNTRQTADSVPGLRELPILGPLFRSDRYENNETDLVIVVTPYLVRPANQRMVLPTDPYLAPLEPVSEIRQLGSVEAPAPQTIPLAAIRPSARSLAGSAGFILE